MRNHRSNYARRTHTKKIRLFTGADQFSFWLFVCCFDCLLARLLAFFCACLCVYLFVHVCVSVCFRVLPRSLDCLLAGLLACFMCLLLTREKRQGEREETRYIYFTMRVSICIYFQWLLFIPSRAFEKQTRKH